MSRATGGVDGATGVTLAEADADAGETARASAGRDASAAPEALQPAAGAAPETVAATVAECWKVVKVASGGGVAMSATARPLFSGRTVESEMLSSAAAAGADVIRDAIAMFWPLLSTGVQ